MRFINNSLSKENLAIGLIVISNDDVRFKFSDEKIRLIRKLNPNSLDLVNFTINKIKHSINSSLKNEKELFQSKNIFTKEYLDRLSSYNNGILQFDKPSGIDILFDDSFFNSFFNKYIDLGKGNFALEKQIQPVSEFKRILKTQFYKPLVNQIDVDFKIKKKQIPSLYFDYHLDGIGVNGVVYSIKGIDLNSKQSPATIAKDISEFESFNQRLDSFSKSKGISGDNKHYLVIDQPHKGARLSYIDLYDILSESDKNLSFYELISSNDLNNVVSQLKENNARKFSEEFLLEL
ncbi:hypothetical protein Q4599_03465 [Cellulophaga lytica]|uniref:hypothetical protein n=1 Tax=Cellulophaga lytica TaxID=979 RepID=UPI0026E393EF|nr:hypothetical protein [Cellulophaga lytica]MDO6852621.1 hypothetical protein [Cellulophaga lytica]